MQQGEISIGVICPLPIEVAAMVQMLDERYGTRQYVRDSNLYHLGRIGKHNIVIAGLPDGLTGIASANTVAERLWVTFTSVKALFLVGIGGGAYTAKNDIRLGDVVVSRPDGRYGGVVQYDFGKSLLDGRFEYTGALNSPPRELLSTLAALRANHLIDGMRPHDYLTYLETSQSNPNFKCPGGENDLLFEADYRHAGGSDCSSCDKAMEIARKPRNADGPAIHYGTIASANQLMRDSKKRDLLNKDYDNRILCFEMEAAGLMNSTPCLVIRGISDYADSHKREDHVWHGYAAAAAAAFTKEFINTIPGDILRTMSTVAEALANDGTPKAHWLVPFQRNLNFIGRKSQLTELSSKLSSDVSCQQAAVVGLGGVGKTQVVLEFAYQVRDRSPNCAIFWVPAISSATFEQAYLQIGQLLQIPGVTEKNADVKQLVKTKLSGEGSGPWLLVVDNADDIDVLYKRAYGDSGSLALIDYLPSSCYGSIIFTTRNRKVAIKLAGSNVINIYEMDLYEGRKVLEKSLIQRHVLEEDEAIFKLLNLLACLPLALIQAAAFINANDISISSYIDLYDNGEDEIIELLSEDFEDQGRYRDKDVKNPIATTWLISFNHIIQYDRLAADYLSFMSCLVPQKIPKSLLPPVQSKVKMASAIGTLTAYSFISNREMEQSFDMHRLVHLATRNWLRKTQSLSIWAEKALSRLADVFPEGDHNHRATWIAYFPHARQILASPFLSDNSRTNEAVLLHKCVSCLISDGQFVEAERMSRQLLELCQNSFSPEHPQTLGSMHSLGVSLRLQGKYVEAEQLLKENLKLTEKVGDLEHRNALATVSQLGLVLSDQGKYVEAEKLHQQTLELERKILGIEHPDTLNSMNSLATVLCNQGKYVEAEQLQQHTLELKRRILGLEHPNTLNSMNNLATILRLRRKYVEAEDLYQQTLELRGKLLGLEHPDTLRSMHNIAIILSDQGRYIEAEQLHRQTLGLRRSVVGLEHPETLKSMNNLATVLFDQGKYSEAEQLHQHTLELRRSIVGLENPDTLMSMHNLAAVLSDQGKYIEAEQLYKQTLELRKRVLGIEHPDTLNSMNNLAIVLRCQRKYVEAEDLYQQTLDMRIKVLGPDHPDALRSMNKLAVVLEKQGKFKEAEKLRQQWVAIRKNAPETSTEISPELYKPDLGLSAI